MSLAWAWGMYLSSQFKPAGVEFATSALVGRSCFPCQCNTLCTKMHQGWAMVKLGAEFPAHLGFKALLLVGLGGEGRGEEGRRERAERHALQE